MRAKPWIGISIATMVAMAGAARGQEVSEAAMISAGAATFRHYCRTCHGPEARGDGPVAQFLTPKPADLTRIRERNEHRVLSGRRIQRGEQPFEPRAFLRCG